MKDWVPIVFLISFSFVSGQTEIIDPNDGYSEEPCEFCSYPPLAQRNEQAILFPEELMKKEKIRKVIAYSRDKYPRKGSTVYQIERPYVYRTYRFDNNGRISSKVVYFSGEPMYKYYFERDTEGKIIKEEEENLIDESSEEFMGLGKILDYAYDESGNLIRKKYRNGSGDIVSDEQAFYWEFEYTKENLLLRETEYDNDGFEPRVWMFREYSGFQNGKPTQYTYGERPPLGGKLLYDENWQLVKNIYKDSIQSDPLSFEITYEYDNQGRLIKLDRKSTDLEQFGCPEEGNLTDHYEYEESGLLRFIKHSYKERECYMVFEYKR
ncbi:hypothetical protein POV27_12115 [Aureisphaera galaxeae]|uniref:hypothetical protein n=1 Tax=Aureisphaera galaxeae TaxID=1538023 RepID=UPI00234FB9C5|nr:hypothetical protein [Aureisphaera galaxeae]MDC8004800.1 hypothetical protein [Aureisphaera galaxeae]